MFNFFKKIFSKTKVKKCAAIIVAGGKGLRMGLEIPKQYYNINGKAVIYYTLCKFQECFDVEEIILVVREEDIILAKEIVDTYEFDKVSMIVAGGQSRQQSVYKGLLNVSKELDYVLVHDAVRPFVKPAHINEMIYQLSKNDCVALGVKPKDTIKLVDENDFIIKTVERDRCFLIQTPQGFKKKVLLKAHLEAMNKHLTATDDCALAEYAGFKIKVIEGDYSNIKITTFEDLYIAESLLNADGDRK